MSVFADNQTYIATIVAAYWFVSISMVYVNKLLVSNNNVSIDAPIFVTFFQCICTVAICYAAGEIGERTRKSHAYNQVDLDEDSNAKGAGNNSFYSQFPKAEFKKSVSRKVMPLSLVFVGMIAFNNLCLKHVEVSFYTVARSLTIVFNVVLSLAILGIPTSAKTLVCLAVVVLGFLIGSKGELNFSFLGTTFGILSSVFVSLNSIYTKKVLPAVDDDHWKLTFYNNVNACFLLIPLILLFESGTILSAMDRQLSSPIFWMAMIVAGVFGFGIGIITVLQIKATSPLTHNISGTAKAACQSMMAFVIWGNKATFMGILGIFTVLGGSLAYTFVKMSEVKRPPRQSAAVSPKNDTEMQSSPSSQTGKK